MRLDSLSDELTLPGVAGKDAGAVVGATNGVGLALCEDKIVCPDAGVFIRVA